MPGLRSMSHTANGVTLVSVAGSITLTKAQVIAHFQAEVGTVPVRVTATIVWVRQQIGTALGIDPVDIGFLFDGITLTGITVGPGASAMTKVGF